MTQSAVPSAQQVLRALQEARTKLEAVEQRATEPIAIIGLGCRFPGAENPAAFWQLLQQGRDAITEIPADRWDVAATYSTDPNDPTRMYTRHIGALAAVDQFDANFFGISPREANALDPQQRLLLEVCWEALEQAGLPPDQLRRTATGVFIGLSTNDYSQVIQASASARRDHHHFLGTLNNMAAGRIAYHLGLQGPTLQLDTACSSSLVAVHLACQSLRNDEAQLALAGGVNLILAPQNMIGLCQLHALAPDGRCKTFDAAADGYGRGEGCGVVVLKRLSLALADGDPILALIRGSAINHDGPSSGLTTPNGPAQEQLLRQALHNARLSPQAVSYVEAHGTGTTLGDPIEIGALTAVFQPRTDPLWIGSVKTNIGHLEAAAGIAGLIKLVLSLQQGVIPPHLHLHNPNPLIDWAAAPVQVPTTLTPWSPPAGAPRIGGVSAFGFSGTNAHLLVEQAPPLKNQMNATATPPWQILTLSAKSATARDVLAQRYLSLLAEQPALSLADLCVSANTGRNHFAHRLAIVADSVPHLQAKLAAYGNGETAIGVSRWEASEQQPVPTVAFLFTGQGSQYATMGRDLYATQPLFRQLLDRCDAILRAQMGESILAVLFPETRDTETRDTETRDTGMGRGEEVAEGEAKSQKPKAKIDDTTYTQPALFVLEYALAQLWFSWGIQPEVVIGHSVGELAAACVAGVFSLEDGLKLVAARGRLMGALPQDGAMVALTADEATVQAALAPFSQVVAIAAVNGPASVVISGQRPAIEAIIKRVAAEGIKATPLAVSHAFHSPLMEPMLAPFRQVAQSIIYHPPTRPLVSNVTGKLAGQEVTTPDYWVRHVRDTVRFADGIQTLQTLGVDLFLEIGPKPTLSGFVRDIYDRVASGKVASGKVASGEVASGEARSVSSITQSPNHPITLSSLRPAQNAWTQMLTSLAELYVRGVAVDWQGVYQGEPRRKVLLPTYPFQRQSYGVPSHAGGRPSQERGLRPLIDRQMKAPLHKQTIFEKHCSVETLPFLADHLLYNTVVMPGACHLALALSGAEVALGGAACELADVVFHKVLPLTTARTVQLLLTTAATDHPFQIISFTEAEGDEAVTHATGRLRAIQAVRADHDLALIQQRCQEAIDPAHLYDFIRTARVDLGPTFRWFTQIRLGDQEVIAQLRRPAAITSTQGYPLFPSLIDACFQLCVTFWLNEPAAQTVIPFAVDALRFYGATAQEELWCHVRQVGDKRLDIDLFDQAGALVATVRGFTVRAATPDALYTPNAWQEWLYQVVWAPGAIYGLPPRYLPTPVALAAPLQEHVRRLATEEHWQQAQAQWQALDAVAIHYLLAAFDRVGFTFHPGARLRTEQIAQQAGVLPRYRRWLARALAMLAEEGILASVQGEWQVLTGAALPPPADHPSAPPEVPDETPEAQLLARCGEKLSEVWRGVQEPLDLLFPNGETHLLRELYTTSPAAQVMNALVQAAVQAALANLPVGQGVRIVEIGAGTGGTTSGLLPLLPAEQTDYCFTDISPAFLTQAQSRFADYHFVRYQPLDIEQPLVAQGFALHQADLVLAANVLHATRNLGETLTQVRQLLQPGGWLVLLEATSRRRWLDLTFGLTDGWWRFADERTDHPLLAADQWQALLLTHGFQAVQVMEQDGQAVIMAQADAAVTPTGRSWLLFADAAGTGAALADQLQGRGETAVLVYAGEEYQSVDTHTYHIRPTVAADYQRLLAALPAVHGVVHLWSLDGPAVQHSADLDKSAQAGCGTVLPLVQALLQQSRTPAGLWLVTRGAQSVATPDKLTGVAQAPLWGMGKVIALEHPELHSVCLDLADNLTDSRADVSDPLAEEAALLCAELLGGGGRERETQVALRPDARYVARLSRHPVPSQPQTAPVIHADATYLITGGLGGLGLAVAQWLADQGARHLLLIGRSQPKAAIQSRLAALATQGVTVTTAQVDVTDQEQVQSLLARIDGRYPLRGVIHSAGVLADGALFQQSWAQFAQVLAPKVQGTWHLHAATQGLALDFFVLFSSAASLLGNHGQANHAAANAFLDAFAHYRRAQGLPALSINWGVWAEIGAAAELVRTNQQQLAARGLGVISPQQGMAALAGLLNQAVTQIGVIPTEWPKFIDSTALPQPFFSHFSDQVTLAAGRTPHPATATPPDLRRQLATALPSEYRALLLAYLQQEVAHILLLPALPAPQMGFMELGMDSLMAIELRRRLEKGLQIALPSTVAFEYPTVTLLADYLQQELLPTPTPTVAANGHAPTLLAVQEAAAMEALSDEALVALISQEFEDLVQ